jgi:hypothetical protein
MGFFSSFTKGANKFFKKDIGGGASKFFKKGKIDGTKVFGKGSIASKALGGVSKGLGQAGSVLGSVGKVLNNPLVQTGLMALGPEAGLASQAITSGLQTGSSALKQGSQLTKQSTYRGNPSQVAGNILERASGIVNTVTPQDAVQSASMGQPASVSYGGQSYKMM